MFFLKLLYIYNKQNNMKTQEQLELEIEKMEMYLDIKYQIQKLSQNQKKIHKLIVKFFDDTEYTIKAFTFEDNKPNNDNKK